MEYDFSGYATKNDLKCTDGRTIRKDAFKANDGEKVPLVWQHGHKEPSNVLGHAILENREDGVYVYGKFNNTDNGKHGKEMVHHGDVKALSIYANNLVQRGSDVVHGIIREVSLVLTGANPGAFIDNVILAHSDGSVSELEDEAIISTGEQPVDPSDKKEIEHADSSDSDETVGDIFNTFTDKQKDVVYAMIADVAGKAVPPESVEHSDENNEELEHSEEEGENLMKKNLFDQSAGDEKPQPHLTHEQFSTILATAQRVGSFREAFLAHAGTYGIDNIDYLFPDAQSLTSEPTFIKRRTEWVDEVLSGAKHSPFSRIKCVHADLTPAEARARGYVTGALKVEEVIALLKRFVTPVTIYKKQKLDRDDILDITEMNVVAWLKNEMRLMLDEEIARAVLISDGRLVSDPDKIPETNVIPIWTDSSVYVHNATLALNTTTAGVIDGIITARKEYKGSGNPTMFIGGTYLTAMLLLKDSTGRYIYNTVADIAAKFRVKNIVEVPLMDSLERDNADQDTVDLVCIMVNMNDYTIGADKGGAVTMFDDFDIDYNQQKYLLETRLSGMLTIPSSAVVVELITAEFAG